MAEIVLARALSNLFPGSPNSLEMEGAANVGEVIEELNCRWPGMRDRLCAPGPVIRQHLNVFVDGEMGDISTPVRPESVVYLLTAVSGG